MKENMRKCVMCGSSPSEDANITLHRFPKPGRTNSLRCELWAKYTFPNELWSSPEFQAKLHSQHLMLCNKHFKSTSIVNRKLFRTAVPSEDSNKAINDPLEPNSVLVPVAGPSRIDQPLTENNTVLNTAHMSVQPECNEKQFAPVTVQSQLSNFSNLVTKQPQNEKDSKLYIKMIQNMKKVCRLQKTIKHLKSVSFINVLNKDKSVNEILKSKVSSTFALLLQRELCNFKRKTRARRWNTEAKITALRLYKRSPTCYKLLRRLICLPAPNTLKSLLNQFHLSVGLNKSIFNVLKQTVKSHLSSEKEYVLIFDEMSIKKHLQYNSKEDFIEGYQDHDSQERASQIASYALVFMVACIRKQVKQPVAYYLSGGSVTADRLPVLIKEVLMACFDAGLNIAATVCDLNAVNKRALTNLGATGNQPYIHFENQEIITIFDTPHLLKCFRNVFLKYDIKCQTNITSDNVSGIGIAKWSYIQKFYELDNNNPNFVFAPSLKQEHLNPNTKQKMKVKLAVQVLSHSVAAGMYAKIAQGELSSDATTTANVIANMDKLFDSVNSYTPDHRRGKPLATNLKDSTDHLKIFKHMKDFFNNLTFLGCRSSPPSKEGWVWTLNGLERLWRNLKTKHKFIKSLSTRQIQQHPLENLFGCIRANCGANTNPTVGQFVAGLNTAVLSNLSHTGSGNCELDENEVIISNFKTLLTPIKRDIYTADNVTEKIISENVDNLLLGETINDTNGEMQACAYVCGFIIKNNSNNSCESCKKMFVSDTQDIIHKFIDFKKYEEIKNTLIYASKDLLVAVEKSATIINRILDNDSHKRKLFIYIKELLLTSVNWEFLDECDIHKSHNLIYVINSTFHICVKRFCVLKNRQFAQESSMCALKRKLDILSHK